MHKHQEIRHEHIFNQGNEQAERGTRAVVIITAIMMIAEIAAGWWFNSMAVLADGWHMGSHALAIGLSTLAYVAARRWAHDPRFTFGTWKIEVLGGFSSAIFLLGVAAAMVITSIHRIIEPQQIHYQEAIIVAIAGLAVNIVSAVILGRAHDDGHDHGHDHAISHKRDGDADLNLKSAYLHVIADAATSVLAIVALAGGWIFGWSWLDPVIGIVGAILVAVWAKGLLIETGKVLVDREMDQPLVEEIKEVLKPAADFENTDIIDLHVWRVGKASYSCAISLVTHDEKLTSAEVRRRLAVHEEIVHSTIEINHCPDNHSSTETGTES